MNAAPSTREPVERRFGPALRQLAHAQKSAKGAPAYSRFVNRKLGRVFAALAYVLGLTPNQVTAISTVFTFTGIGLVAFVEPSPWMAAGTCAALVLGYGLDAADGQLARLRGGGSLAGEWLDHVIDCAKHVALHTAVLVSFYRYFDLDRPAYLLIPLGFQAVAVVMFFTVILNDQLRRRHQALTGTAPPEPARPSTIRALLVVPTDYGLLCLTFALFGFTDVFFAAYALIFAGNLLFLVAALVKWFRDIAALDSSAPAAAQSRSLASSRK